jgi:hypothetical protein
MNSSIGIIQKARHIAEFVDDVPTLLGRPEIRSWNKGTIQRTVWRGEIVETAKVAECYQPRHFVVQLRNGASLRASGHAIETLPPAASSPGFVIVVCRSITSTSTIALFAADQVVSIIEEQPASAPSISDCSAVASASTQPAPAESSSTFAEAPLAPPIVPEATALGK